MVDEITALKQAVQRLQAQVDGELLGAPGEDLAEENQALRRMLRRAEDQIRTACLELSNHTSGATDGTNLIQLVNLAVSEMDRLADDCQDVGSRLAEAHDVNVDLKTERDMADSWAKELSGKCADLENLAMAAAFEHGRWREMWEDLETTRAVCCIRNAKDAERAEECAEKTENLAMAAAFDAGRAEEERVFWEHFASVQDSKVHDFLERADAAEARVAELEKTLKATEEALREDEERLVEVSTALRKVEAREAALREELEWPCEDGDCEVTLADLVRWSETVTDANRYDTEAPGYGRWHCGKCRDRAVVRARDVSQAQSGPIARAALAPISAKEPK
jgi:hypothetical protein